MRWLFLIFIAVISLRTGVAQNRPVIPELGPDAPDWMFMLSGEQPNVREVQKAYERYYTTTPFVKNTYTQYYKRFMRWARPFTNGEGYIRIPDAAEEAARERRIQAIRNQADRTANWTYAGPRETWHTDGTVKVTWQTNIYSLDIAPSNANILFAGGESGGVWKTTDKGLNWELKTAGILHGAFGAVKIHPSNPDIVFICTGGKILRTVNGGSTWVAVYTENNLWVNEMAFSHSNPNIVLAAADNGILRSTDGGTTWVRLFSATTWTIKRKENNGTTFYAVRDAGSSSEFIRSDDQGLTWTVYNSGWWAPATGESMTGAIIATCPSDPERLYAYLIGSGGTLNGYAGVYVSTNNGATWTNTNPSNAIGGTYTIPTHTNLMAHNGTDGFNQGFYDMAIVVNPNNASQLIAGGTSWFKSTDGGATWNTLGGYVSGLGWSHPDIQWCAAAGNDLWIASDGGLNYSSNFGQSIEARMDGITGSDMWGFGSGWNTDLLVGGRYHNGNMARHESFAPGKYYRMGGGEAATGYVSPGPGNRVYHSDIGGHQVKPGFGNGLESFSVGAWPNESYAYYANSEMVFHPNYYQVVYIGKDNQILKSEDGGATYTVLYTFPGGTSNDVFEIQISRSNPNIMYCSQWDGVDDAMWRSQNGGMTWTALTPLPLPNNNDRVKMAVSSADPNVLWVAVTYGSNGKKVYKSINGGASWTNLTTSLLNGISVQGIMAQYGTNGGVYIGTNAGVFYRNNSHTEWQPYSTGLPLSVETNRLKPFYKENKIRNGCWGFGVWESGMYEPSLPEAMPTLSAPVIRCSRDTVFFDDYSVLNHTGASWQWSFPGSSWVSSTSVRNPRVLYGQNGVYDVTLTVTDAAGNSSSRTITGMITLASECAADSIAGKALQASGSSQHATVPNAAWEDVDSLTVTAWVRPSGIQPDYSAIFMGDGPDAAGFNFKDGTNKLAYHWPGGQWWWNSNINVPSNQWSFVAMVVKPTGITLYCNEQSATHSFTLTPTDIPAFRIGSYRNWGSRNMNGLIDEVAIYNRPLTTSELRELRHLTRKPASDPGLIAYYQFNSSATHDFDKVGTRHVFLTSGTTKLSSTAPVGGGVSQRMTVNTGGTKTFPVPGVTLYFPSGTTYPNGELVISKLNVLPDQYPVSAYPPNGYWIINNYGTNAIFTEPDSVRFSGSGNITSGCQDLDYLLYKRGPNAEGSNWSGSTEATFHNGFTGVPFVTFDNQARVNTSFQLFMVRDNAPYPASWEICNGQDDDCDGLIDENYSLTVTQNGDSGANSLRAILQCAQPGDTIRFAASVDTIQLLSPLVFSKELVVLDDTGPRVVLALSLQGNGFASAPAGLQCTAAANMTFSGVDILHSGNTASRPVILNYGTLSLHQCRLSGIPSTLVKNEPGAVFLSAGTVILE